MFQFTMILHRIRIIVRDARLEHQTAASAVWKIFQQKRNKETYEKEKNKKYILQIFLKKEKNKKYILQIFLFQIRI